MAERQKHRLFVVGGRASRNAPEWLAKVFDIEHFQGEEDPKQRPEPKKQPDAVIVLSSWISHKHFNDAQDLAEKHDIPLILSPGGWSAAIQRAILQGVDWFVQDIEAAKHEIPAENPVEATESIVDNAWREAYNREMAGRQAAERRLRKVEAKLEAANAKLKQVSTKEAAADRVIAKIREAAQEQRERLDKASVEVQKIAEETRARNARLAACLMAHFESMKPLVERITNGEQILVQAAKMMAETRSSLEWKMSTLTEAIAEIERADAQPITTPSLTKESFVHISQAREATSKRS